MAEKLLLKDLLFNEPKVVQIASEIEYNAPAFKKRDFINEVISEFPERELKARIYWITECLKKYLPCDYREAVKILIRSLPPPNNPNLSDGDFGDFIYAPYAHFVAQYGCHEHDLEYSLEALRQITMRFSAEDAMRYFINAFPKKTLKELLQWCSDKHYHVRRLCSESTRPKLPWCQKILLPLTEALPILDHLFDDKTRFVTRSVANHLNDISKTDPQLVIATLTKWRASKKQEPKEIDFITRHSLRTLIKQGHTEAMQLLGFSHQAPINVSNVRIPKKATIDTAFEFSFTINAPHNTNVIADYVIYFQNKKGNLNSKKVFKIKTLSLKKEEPVTITKQHPFRKFMTTRTLYPGQHELEIKINGKSHSRQSFLLVF